MSKFMLRFSGDRTLRSQRSVPVRWRKAFLCYAASDRDEVLHHAKVLSLVGIETSIDAVNLSRGDEWDRQIFRAIDKADVFVLFWSTAARV